MGGETSSIIQKIKKRNGQIVPFEQDKITAAIFKAAKAVGGENWEQAVTLTKIITAVLEERFGAHTVPTVEQIQDLVEQVLIKEGHDQTAKAYILYREQHKQIRDVQQLVDGEALMEDYIGQADWRVNENGNMSFSVQGLNNYISSAITARYWLNKLYPQEIREAHKNADLHLHDLGLLAVYCCGWDLKDLITRGFGGTANKVCSSAPKHFRTALGQLVNFLYTLQGEAAGAQAVANFDTLLAPFIRYDDLSYKEIKQSIQEFLFNMNVPTRVGFQCLSEDTEILTVQGWKRYDEVKKGDIIKTFNVQSKKIENQKVNKIFARYYEGEMYNLKNRIQDQLISPHHRVVRKIFQSDKYALEPIEDVIALKSPVIIPIAGKNTNHRANISDDQIKLMAWIISEGTIERPTKYRCCYRVSIYQSKEKNNKNYLEIAHLLKRFKLKYTEYESASLGNNVKRFRLNAESSRTIHQWFGTRESVAFIPESLMNLDEKQAKLFLETYVNGDGFEGCKIATANPEILDGLEIMAVNAGYGFTVLKRKPTIGKKDIYVLRLIKHQETYIQEIKKVEYRGIIWCPNTKNETVVARRNGKVFITGNTPFTNITMDVKPSGVIANENVIIGGKIMPEKYGDFQKEMDMINQAFAEAMLRGDANGRMFAFPIPTYNISKDFDWDNPALEKVWEMTAKYGVPYFSNFINSDMSPDDARSMCPLGGNEKVLVRSSRGRGFEYSNIRYIYEGNSKQQEYEIYSDGKFVKGKFNKFTNQKMMRVELANGHKIEMSEQHLNYVMQNPQDKKIKTLKGSELKAGIYLPYSLKSYQGEGGNEDLGYFVGAYAGDGSFDGDSTVVFSLEGHYKKELITKLENIAKKYFGANSVIKTYQKSKLVTVKIHSQAAVGLCRDFVESKQRDKHYKARLFATSFEFRKKVLAGHYATDGGNRNRIYTSSKKMVETLNMLAATLGTTTSVYKDNRDGRFGEEPNYAVLIYQLNRNNYGNIWFKHKEKLWIKIKTIKHIANNTAYCFEVKNDEPMFTVGTTGILTHNCRLRLDNRELRKRGGGLFGANPMTGSIGVVTLNMARLGYLSKGKPVEELMKKIDHLMEMARTSLKIKRKVLERFTDQSLYPYSKYWLKSVKERFGEYWKNHFNTIGLNGMNECLLNYIGKGIETKEGKELAVKVLDHMRDNLKQYQELDDDLYNLEATPAEGTTYRFAKKDLELYPDIIFANTIAVKEESARPYYTNSTHLPVGATDDIFEALDLQDELQTKYTGGTVLHGFLGERIADPQMCKKLVRRIAENYKLPYYTITPTFSICPKHGYIAGEHFYCPKCDDEIKYEKKQEETKQTVKKSVLQKKANIGHEKRTKCEVYSRVVGWIVPVAQWNEGKKSEFIDRITYDKQLNYNG